MRERRVLVSNVLEKMQLILVCEEGRGDAVYRRIAPALVVEPARLVEEVKEGGVGLAAPEVHVCDFKITPDCALALAIGVFIVCCIHLQWQRL